jgi:hypothetical protein
LELDEDMKGGCESCLKITGQRCSGHRREDIALITESWPMVGKNSDQLFRVDPDDRAEGSVVSISLTRERKGRREMMNDERGTMNERQPAFSSSFRVDHSSFLVSPFRYTASRLLPKLSGRPEAGH